MNRLEAIMAMLLAGVFVAGCENIEIEIELDGDSSGGQTIMQEADWDTLPSGEGVTHFTLTNQNGVKATLMDYGANLLTLEVPDRDGNMDDIVLGFDEVEPYTGASPYMGATVGRYANRIAAGKFTLDGQEYTLAINNEPNHLHGGDVGFDKVLWDGEPFSNEDGVGVRFTYTSKDMEEGYPGNLTSTVTYTLTNEDELRIDYEAETDKKTHINLTHHSYFNLGGASSGDTILDHVLEIEAARYTPVDATGIPTGAIPPVAHTPFDFTTPHVIGERIDQVEGGYDHNYALDSMDGSLTLAATVRDPESGRVMEIRTTEPGLQFYTGNFLDGTLTGKDDTVYEKNFGLCLEAHKYPDSPNRPDFPTSVLEPGQTYRQTTVHKFYAE